MAIVSVGESRFGELRGVEQFLEADAARQLNLCLDFVGSLPGLYRPTVNEGNRSRARQDIVWFRYLNGGPLAAVRYTSTHDEFNAGNAADLGGPNGEVLTAAVLDALRTYGPAYGVFPTGMNFSRPELWHFNVYSGRAIITSAATTLVPIEPKEEADMATTPALYLIQTKATTAEGVIDTWLVNPETFSYTHMASDTQSAFWQKLGAIRVEGVQPGRVLENFTPVNTTGKR